MGGVKKSIEKIIRNGDDVQLGSVMATSKVEEFVPVFLIEDGIGNITLCGSVEFIIDNMELGRDMSRCQIENLAD